ncbi:unnamed protein product, partial [marine sediment metagenome]
QTVRFRISINASETPDDHVVRMEVSGPDDKDRWYLAENVLVPAAGVQLALPFAFNDPPGKWTVRLRDITSGKRLERAIVLSP